MNESERKHRLDIGYMKRSLGSILTKTSLGSILTKKSLRSKSR